MNDETRYGRTSRRRFLQYLAMLTVGGRVLLRSGDARAAVDAAQQAAADPETWPTLPKRTLGRTGFEATRLVFGCGAALSGGRNDALLEAARRAGINVFDVGSSSFYADAEKNLAPFLKKVRSDVFLISKAMVGLELEPGDALTADQAKKAAATWSERLDRSLAELEVDRVDAYYVMAANNPTLVASDEILAAFEGAEAAGKVRYLGLSTHQNQERVLRAAAGTGRYSLAMVAVTPGGWYDWKGRGVLAGSKPMAELRPFLDEICADGIALVGMKAGRHLAGRRFIGWSNPDAFDEHYDEKFLAAKLSAFQRSYAFVLAHGLDVVNADMQSLPHLHENVVAAATSDSYFA